jgi:SecD/SecF fusion protein
MQNKGAIKIFAILLALACIFYLSFTWITSGVESDALEYAESTASSARYKMAAGEFAKGNASKEKSFIDSVKLQLADRYLDSMKRQTVYDILIAEYTYEECKKNAINLGLDLRGGMNVTLEVSVKDIIINLANKSADIPFNKALDETQKNLGVNNNDDFITLFEKTYKKVAPNGRLAPLFQSIENKSNLSYNASNEEVIKYISERVGEAIANAEKTFRSRIDRFGVTQPNIQKLEARGRILVELPGVKDKERVRELLQGTANLEFWETYENGEIAPMMDKANAVIAAYLSGSQSKSDTTATDSLAVKANSLAAANTSATPASTNLAKKDSTGIDSAAKAVQPNLLIQTIPP